MNKAEQAAAKAAERIVRELTPTQLDWARLVFEAPDPDHDELGRGELKRIAAIINEHFPTAPEAGGEGELLAALRKIANTHFATRDWYDTDLSGEALEQQRKVASDAIAAYEARAALSAAVPRGDRDVLQKAEVIVETVLGFNNLDDLGALPRSHPNRKHVEKVVANILDELTRPTPDASADGAVAIVTAMRDEWSRIGFATDDDSSGRVIARHKWRAANEILTAFEKQAAVSAAPQQDALIDEVQQRMDAVVGAAVAWHQAEGADDWAETHETLCAKIVSLLELRSAPLPAPPVAEEKQ